MRDSGNNRLTSDLSLSLDTFLRDRDKIKGKLVVRVMFGILISCLW